MTPLTQAEQQVVTQATLPSFSIVYETENLSSVELENIYRSLDSLAAQDLSLEEAKEFLIIDSGFATEDVIAELSAKYPWITVQRTSQISYYEAKMIGAKQVTGEIVVFCDSDCQYTPSWLRNVLTFFAQNPEAEIVAGETSTPIRNPYELAIAMHYIFPRFSKQEQPYPSGHYFLNGVAFRRDFLIQNPIPTDLPLYRGNCAIHTYWLCGLKNHVVWRHPQATALHEPPTLSFITWRYLLRGRDRVLRKHIQNYLSRNPDLTHLSSSSFNLNLTLSQKLHHLIQTLLGMKLIFKYKTKKVLKEDYRRSLLVPLVFPYILWFEFLYTLGSIITYFQPDLLIRLYYKTQKE